MSTDAVCSELVWLTEGGIDPQELIDILQRLQTMQDGGLPGKRITSLSLTDHLLKITLT